MKKNLFLTAILISVGSLMVACGTEDTSDQTTNSSSQEQPAEETVTPETEVDPEITEDAETSEAPAETEDATEVTEEGPSQAETEGTLTTSDEQPYEIRVVRGYELTSEEPGKDVLFLSEDSSVFMRIETFPKADISFEQAVISMKDTVQASSPEQVMTEIKGPQGEEFLNSAAYEIPTIEGKVTGIVYEKEEIIVRLTIFDSTDATATEDFIDMAKTIEPQKK